MFIRKAFVFVFAALLLVLSACTVQSGWNMDGTETDGTDFGGSNVSVNTGDVWQKDSATTSGTYLIEEQNMENASEGIRTLEIKNTAGNIKVLHTDSATIEIKAVKKVRGLDDKLKREIMDKIDIRVEKDGERLKVYALTSENQASGLWGWVEKFNKGLNLTIDYEVKIPNGIKVYNIDLNAGNTTFQSVQGEITLKQNAGTVNFDRVILDGSCRIDMNAGNVIMDADIDNAKALTIKGNAGNVNIKLPEKSAFSLDTRLGAGNITGDFLQGTRVISGKLIQDFNGGGTKLTVTLSAGNVTISKK